MCKEKDTNSKTPEKPSAQKVDDPVTMSCLIPPIPCESDSDLVKQADLDLSQSDYTN